VSALESECKLQYQLAPYMKLSNVRSIDS